MTTTKTTEAAIAWAIGRLRNYTQSAQVRIPMHRWAGVPTMGLAGMRCLFIHRENMMEYFVLACMVLVFLLVAGPRLTFTPEGCVKVLTSFGKYSRMVQPGASWMKPWERTQTISLQNRSMELEFEAITIDQANVYFKCLLLYRVADSAELTIKRAAFAFAEQAKFSTSMQRLIEDETRTFV
jgi:regulator of protease activity HflC (stomatin/prohibitin superfamily)